ncbi:hypothetical protein AB6F55_04765 [Providencia hangzhouensis]
MGNYILSLPPPYEINNEIIARIKILAKMNIAEKRRSQYGQMSWHFDGKITVSAYQVFQLFMVKN